MASKKKPRKSIFVRLLVIGVAVYMIVTLKTTATELNRKQKELADIRRETADVQLEIKECEELLANDAVLIERAARERLDYGYPSETYYKQG